MLSYRVQPGLGQDSAVFAVDLAQMTVVIKSAQYPKLAIKAIFH